MKKTIVYLIVHFLINAGIFYLILLSSLDKSGGDIFFIIGYGFCSIIHILIIIFFSKDKQSLFGVALAIIISIIAFKVIEKDKAKQETKFIREKI